MDQQIVNSAHEENVELYCDTGREGRDVAAIQVLPFLDVTVN